MLLGVLLLTGSSITRCSGCEDKKVSSQLIGDFEVAIHHWVCVSVAAYSVSIAPPGTNMIGRADRFERDMQGNFEVRYDIKQVDTSHR